jgi:hypothetical protein
VILRLSKGVGNVAEMEGDSFFQTFWRPCLEVVIEFRDFLVGCLLHRPMIEHASEAARNSGRRQFAVASEMSR